MGGKARKLIFYIFVYLQLVAVLVQGTSQPSGAQQLADEEYEGSASQGVRRLDSYADSEGYGEEGEGEGAMGGFGMVRRKKEKAARVGHGGKYKRVDIHPTLLAPASRYGSMGRRTGAIKPQVEDHCQAWVNKEYQYIYLRLAKSGGTKVLKQLCPGPACPEQMYTPNITEAMWRDYFVWGTIRNPFSRAVSGFLFLTSEHVNPNYSNPMTPQCNVKWNEFCEDPDALIESLKDPDCHRDDRSPYIAEAYMRPQVGCLMPSGHISVDFVIRSERSLEDMHTLVSELNRRRKDGVPEIVLSSEGGVSEKLKSDSRSAPFYDPTSGAFDWENWDAFLDHRHDKWYETYPKCFDGLADYYSEDLSAFRFQVFHKKKDE